METIPFAANSFRLTHPGRLVAGDLALITLRSEQPQAGSERVDECCPYFVFEETDEYSGEVERFLWTPNRPDRAAIVSSVVGSDRRYPAFNNSGIRLEFDVATKKTASERLPNFYLGSLVFGSDALRLSVEIPEHGIRHLDFTDFTAHEAGAVGHPALEVFDRWKLYAVVDGEGRQLLATHS